MVRVGGLVFDTGLVAGDACIVGGSAILETVAPLEVWQCMQSNSPDLKQGLIRQEVIV